MTTPAKSSSPPAGRWSHAYRRVLAEGGFLTAYRVLRRVAGLRCWGGMTEIHMADIFGAAVADLRRSARLPRSFVVRWATEQDHATLAAYYGPDRNIGNRFDRGDHCLLAAMRDQLCAAVWFVPGPGEYLEDVKDFGTRLRVPAGVAFSYDGKGTRWGAWGTLMARAPDCLAELGMHEIVTLIDCGNSPSISSHVSLGYRRIGGLGCVRVARWVRPLYAAAGHGWRKLPGQIGSLSLDRATSLHAGATGERTHQSPAKWYWRLSRTR